jgi:hypothetical protein
MASDGVVSVTILTSLSLLGELVVTVGGTSLVCSRFPPLVLPCSLDSPVPHSVLLVLLRVLPFPTLQLSIEAPHG